jgi:peptide/nickel transport system permease protein
MGYSISSGRAITAILAEKLPATIELAVTSLLISTILGTILGVISALKKGSATDNILSVAGILGLSIPQFFLGMVTILVFALNWKILPVGGRLEPWMTHWYQHLKYLILPSLVLGLSMTAGVMRYARASMLDTMNKDYIKTARSKGVPEWRVNLIHGLRVSLTPVVVLVGFRLPTLIGGSVVIESVFQWPGVGLTFKEAVTSQNYPLVMSIALLSVIAVMLSSLIIDILTRILDPRVQME